jgi:hypothetical protein
MKQIRINTQLDYTTVEVVENGNFQIHHRFEYWPKTQARKEEIMILAKAQCFDVLWELTELGEKAEIYPYLNG